MTTFCSALCLLQLLVLTRIEVALETAVSKTVLHGKIQLLVISHLLINGKGRWKYFA